MIVRVIGLFLAVLVSPIVFGATQPAPPPQIINNGTSINFNVASRGWSDPSFEGMGWTHFSQWGQMKLKNGQTAVITVVSSDANVHPGLTVWYRPATQKGNKGKGLTYVPDHFYPQTSDYSQANATDEITKKSIGNIVMKYVVNGYDADGNDPNVNVQTQQLNNPNVAGIIDGVPGTLKLIFTAAKTGIYQFAVGGINPYPVAVVSAMKSRIPQTVRLEILKPY
jgi:hypothetical protein